MHKYVRMTILIIINFPKRGIFLLLHCYLSRTTYDINKGTHGVSLLMVIFKAFYALFFRFFNTCNALQCVNSAVQLPCLIVTLCIEFSMIVDKCYLSYYFINLYNVHKGPFTRAFFISGLCVAPTVFNILSCAFQYGPYRGWLARQPPLP